MLGFSKVGHGDYDAGSRLMEESAQIFRSINDDWGLAYSMNPGGRARLLRGDFEGARSRWQEGLSLFKAMNDEWGLGMTLTNLLDLALHRDDLTGIQTLMDDASRACQESGDRFTFAFLHCMLGDLQRRRGNDSRALENYITCLTTMREIASNNTAARCTFGLGRIAASRNQPALSAQLLGASDHYGGVDSLVAVIRAERDQLETSLRRDLGQQAFDAAWQAGQGLQLAEVQGIAETLLGQELTADQGPAQGSPDHTTQGTLTRRELEVLELLRRGLTNRDIADALVISERTAEHHVTNILQKLNLRSRTQAATWAAEHSTAPPSDTTT
jgi:non-specific serine/threonine protein kinase